MVCSIAYLGQVIDSHCTSLSRSARQGRYIPDVYDLYDLYDLAHAAGWEPHNLHGLGHASLGWIYTIQVLHNMSKQLSMI